MAGRGVLGNFARSLQSLTLASRPVAAPLVAPSMATAAAAQREMTTAKSRARKAGVPHSKTVKIMGHIDRGQKQKIFFPNTIVQFMPNQQ
ncbi:hypothetical protein T484DRAFT_1831685 [Baffinella frigidus]|nr:hypothetical protein T484DRAFT_1831685 [Cryptophyta sp. CCMP2293]